MLLQTALLLLVFCARLLAQQHVAHEERAPGTARDSVAAMATFLSTTVSPALDGRARTQRHVTQPMLTLRSARYGGALQVAGMINVEHWTMPNGEAVAGIWGEGFIDRRHPHTVLHEVMLTASIRPRNVGLSAAVGRGFVPFGSDDPMVRPFTKYPANHHLSQIMERVQLVVAVRPARYVAVEAALFNGDEPLTPTTAPQWNRFSDSRAVRVTLWPVPTVELQSSATFLRSPEFVRAEGLDHAKASSSLRWTPDTSPLRYLLVEWARTEERARSRTIVAYGTGLIEWLLRDGAWSLAGRLEQTSRPEDERLLNPFRTTRPPNHLTVQGITRWRIGTLNVARQLPSWYHTHASLFAEVARAASSPSLRPILVDPRAISGADDAWHLSVGVRAGIGAMAARVGRYGVSSPPTASNVMLGMPHATH